MSRARRRLRGTPPPDETQVIAGEETVALPPDETQVVVEEEAVDPPLEPPLPGAPLEEPPPDRHLWPWLLVLLVLVLGGLAAALLISRDDKKDTQPTTQTATTAAQTVAPLPQTTTKPAVVEVSVPKVVGLKAPEALKALTGAGLTGTTRGVFSNEARNLVVAQHPDATTKVKKGSAVALDVSKGPKSVPVPDVVGQSAADAVQTLKAAGLKVTVVRVPSADPAGQVVAQAPAAGKQAPGGSAVRLNVSDGSGGTPTTTAQTTTAQATTTTTPRTTTAAAPATVTVPDVVGLKLLAARKKIRQAGLVTEFKQVPSTEPRGTVVSQSPKPGTTRKHGDHVLVNVSRGPSTGQGAQAAVPDVTGEDEETATQDLEAAGYTVRAVDQATSDSAEDGVVVSQSPAPGQAAQANSQVTIYIGRFSG